MGVYQAEYSLDYCFVGLKIASGDHIWIHIKAMGGQSSRTMQGFVGK